MELTSLRRHTTSGLVSSRSTLSTQSVAGRPPSQSGSLCSPVSWDGSRLSPAPGSISRRSDGLPSPLTSPGSCTSAPGSGHSAAPGSAPGSAPGLLRQLSAPAESRPRPPVGRLARLGSGPTPSGPFKRPVRQRFGSLGRGPHAAPPRDYDPWSAQVAPPAEGAGRYQGAPPAEGAGRYQGAPPRPPGPGQAPRRSRSPSVGDSGGSRAERTSEQRMLCDSVSRGRAEAGSGRLLGLSYSARVAERRRPRCPGHTHSQSTDLAQEEVTLNIAAQANSRCRVQRTETSVSDKSDLYVRRKRVDVAENCSITTVRDEILTSKSRNFTCFGGTDIIKAEWLSKTNTRPDHYYLDRRDKNKNYIREKRVTHSEEVNAEGLNMFQSDARSSDEKSLLKRGYDSFSEDRAMKRSRPSVVSWNSPDQSVHSPGILESFSEANHYKTSNVWSTQQHWRPSQRSSRLTSQSSDYRQREERSRDRPMSAVPPPRWLQHPPPGCRGHPWRYGSAAAGDSGRRRPPLLPTPPRGRRRPGPAGSPAVTTTTRLGETPPTPESAGAAGPLGLLWAAEMPLLPQLLEPLSPMSPLSVSPPLSPELPLSPLSPLSSPRSPPSARREKMPEGDFYLGPPEPITTCNPRSSHHRTRLTTDRLSDSDSDSDSDSADGQTTRWARARRRGTHRDRLDSASTASGDSSAAPRAERQRRGAARPARAAVGSCPSGAAWPAERRPSDAATPADRFDRQRSSGGRCAECSAGGCSQQPPARPPAADSRHSAPDRHPNTSGPRSPQTQPRPGRPDRPGSGRGTDEPPADLATTCGRPEPTDAANADGRRGSPDGRPGSPNGRAGSPGEPAPRDLTIFTSEYLSELLQLQRRIMTSRDSEEMTRVLELLWGTGQVQDSALYYDFDLCALDQGVVRQLQKCLS